MSAEGLATDALDELVNQFSDPLSFFRELIQNSLDAGTPAIDVRFEFTPDKGAKPADDARGVMVIHVDDYGEGMDREIIDSKLTRLFSSAKDGDLTKIGRFGIGFVSVFAIAPDAVCLDTSRSGEHWRVLFDAQRRFTRIARDTPVDGTKIQLIKRVTRSVYTDLRRRAREVVRYWCKHVAVEIAVDGEPVNEPLGLDALVQVHHTEPGTHVVVGYPRPGEPPVFGFYNKGLTLHEGTRGDFFDVPVSFKVSSRYLEHTLTRDNVLRDDHFDKAMEVVRKLVQRALPEAVFARIEAAVDAEDGKTRDLLGGLVVERAELIGIGLARAGDRRLAPTWVGPQGAKGSAATLARIAEAKSEGRLAWESTSNPQVGAVIAERGALVLRLAKADPLHDVIAALDGPPCERVRAQFSTVAAVARDDDEEAATDRAYEAAVQGLLEAWGAKVAGVRTVTVSGALADEPVITQRAPDGLVETQGAKELGRRLLSRKRWVLLNGGHAAIADLRMLAQATPTLAALMTAKLLLADHALSAKADAALAEAALKRRGR